MEFEMLSILKDKDGLAATYCAGDNSEIVKRVRVDYSDLPYPDDFLYGCAYLIDELAKTPLNKPFEGRTVCIKSNLPDIFKVGKIYEWKDGRTVSEDGKLLPTNKKLYSLDEITNKNLQFIKIVE